MNIVAIVQARMGSTRLPGKVMMSIGGYTLIELLLMRLSESIEVDEIVVATSEHTNNKALVDHVRSLGFRCEEGSENDVLERYYDTAVKCSADVIIRITADCPLIDSAMVDECVNEFKRSGVDYFSNNHIFFPHLVLLYKPLLHSTLLEQSNQKLGCLKAPI